MNIPVIFAGSKALEVLATHSCGHVLSSHDAGMYCRFAPDSVIMLHDAAYGVVPFGLAVPGLPEGKRFSAAAPVFADHGRSLLQVDDSVFDYGNAAQPDMSSCTRKNPIQPKACASAHAFLAQAASRLPSPLYAALADTVSPADSPEPVLKDVLTKILWDSTNALFRQAPSQPAVSGRLSAREAVLSLMGLGPGLTPLGDDILVGFIGALHLFGTIMAEDATRRIIQDITPQIRARCWQNTTPQSAAFLQSAVDGGHFSMLDRCVASLADALEPWNPAPFDRLMRVGHSSGYGLALGILGAANRIVRERNTISDPAVIE